MKRSPHFYLTIITIIGAIARIWFFWSDGLHVDENYTLDLIRHPLLYVIQTSLTTDCNPPLFYIIDWVSVHALGFNAFAERLPSVIAGIALIPAVYYFGKELKSETLGLFSALAVATLGPMWYYSQFGRAYMLECLLFTIFCIYYIRLVRGDSRKANWFMVAGMAVALAYTHLFAVIPLALFFLYLMWQYNLKSLQCMGLTFVLSSPLLLLFNAMLNWRMTTRERAAGTWTWYGATIPQLIVFAPLEFFGYVFVFWIPLVIYSTWIYRKMREVVLLVVVAAISFLSLLALANTTPVFLRYILLFVPILVTIGLLPVTEFVNSDATKAQKWFVIGAFGIMYYTIIFYSFWSGLYMPKGNIIV